MRGPSWLLSYLRKEQVLFFIFNLMTKGISFPCHQPVVTESRAVVGGLVASKILVV